MSDDIIYMDEWLRNHGRSVPMSCNGEALHWGHTSQAFNDEEVKAWDQAYGVDAMDNAPWNK